MVLFDQLKQQQECRNQIKAKHEALTEELREHSKTHEEKMKAHLGVMETKRVALENEERQKEYKEKMLGMEGDNLEQMKKNLTAHELELYGMKSMVNQSAERCK